MFAKFAAVLALLWAMVFSIACPAADPAGVPEVKRTSLGLYLTAEEAYEMVRSRPEAILFVDIRSVGEVQFLGMPTLADANIPYMQQSDRNEWDEAKQNFKLAENPYFAVEVGKRLAAKGLTPNDPVLIMCRSGDRTAKAVNLLAKLGYTQVFSMVDGYEGDLAKDGPNKGTRSVNGWKNAHLPWSYALERGKMYRVEQ